MNSNGTALLTIAGALAIAAVSPGPSFVVVAQTALSTPRGGRVAALGMGVGGFVFALLATAGLHAMTVYAGPIFLVVKVAGGGYLIYLGVRLWCAGRRETTDLQHAPQQSGRIFAKALMAQLSNPKTIVVYGSVFAAALPAHPPSWFLIAVPVVVVCVETSWYSVVATVMSRPAPRRVYGRATNAVDRVCGSLMGGLGSYLAVDGLRTAAH
jgi:threonine/homoserine/homoserine lactone efflux protein